MYSERMIFCRDKVSGYPDKNAVLRVTRLLCANGEEVLLVCLLTGTLNEVDSGYAMNNIMAQIFFLRGYSTRHLRAHLVLNSSIFICMFLSHNALMDRNGSTA